MICFHCSKVKSCEKFRNMYSDFEDFSINKCKDYEDEISYKYKKIAEHDDLMRILYDYFTGQIEGYTDEQVVSAIKNAMLNL